jgi:inner membrane transporter RhtA
MSQLLPLFTIILAMISIQFGASLAKGLFPLVGPAGATTLRLIIASLILLIIWRPWRKNLGKESYKRIAVYGVSLGMMNFLFYQALERIPLGIAVALEFTGPLAVSVYHSKKISDYLWAVLAGLGIYLILPISPGSVALDVLGIILALSAGFCWALYILFGQKAVAKEDGGMVTSLGMLAAAIIVCPFGLWLSRGNLLDPSLAKLALMVGILSSALPYSLEMIALKKLPTKTFGILMSLEPAIAALMGLAFLKEVLSLQQSVAIVCIIVASLGASLNSRAQDETQTPEMT